MSEFRRALDEAAEAGGLPTDDLLARVLPLLRQVADAHDDGLVAPLEGGGALDALLADEQGRWSADPGALAEPRLNWAAVRRVQPPPDGAAVEVVGRAFLDTDLDSGRSEVTDLDLHEGPGPVERPVYLCGYRSWEGTLGHHDALTDVFLLGQILVSLACGVDLSEPGEHTRFVAARRNLFVLNKRLHPVVARVLRDMTEADRHRRAPDVRSLVQTLETYRDQPEDFAVADIAGFGEAGPGARRRLIQTRLRDRLFDTSRRNRLLYFRPTQQTVDLTVASVPQLLDYRNIRPDQLFTWHPKVAEPLSQARPVALGPYLRFDEAPYLPGALDKVASQARRDRAEYGFSQLRLVIAFLRWHDLRGAAEEVIDSPLLLLPVELAKRKGVRDSYVLTPTTSEAEVNPSLRHQLRELYDLRLPESADLRTVTLEEFHEGLTREIAASEPAVRLARVDRPRVDLIQQQARLRTAAFRRRQSAAEHRVRTHTELAYSYHAADYRPLGLQLFLAKVWPAPLPQRIVAGGKGERRMPMAVPGDVPQPAADERTATAMTYALRTGAASGNPYDWELDLCRLTVGNFNYRRMSLVHDYDRLLEEAPPAGAFDEVFRLTPRDPDGERAALPPVSDQYLVVDGDATQLAAIARARTGASYLIQGPPGTGKSQTITNLIADQVARGRRVLFVCEKRAAIDVVYHRLRQRGLDGLCCLIHDSQSDKKSFIADLRAGYERLLGDDPEPADPEAARDSVVRRIDEEFTALRRLTEAMTGQIPAAGRTGIELVNHLVQLRAGLGDQPELTAEQAEVLPVPLDWWPAASPARRLERILSELGQDPVLAAHPIAGVGAGVLDAERPARAARELCEQAREDLAGAEAVAGGVPVLPLPLADVLAIAAAAVRIAPLAREQATDLLDAGSHRSRRFDALAHAQETKAAALGAARAAASGWRQPLPADEVAAAVQLARAKEGRPLSFLSGRWRALKKRVAAGYGGPGGVSAALELLATVQRAQAELGEVEAAARTELGIGDLPGTAELVRNLRPLTTSPHRRLAAFATSVAADRSGTEALAWASIHPAVAAAEGTLGALLADPGGHLFGELAQVVDGVSAELDLLPVLLDGLRELAEAPAGVRRALRELPFPAGVIEYAAAHRALRDWFAQDRAVARLDGEAIERRLEAIGHLRRELLERNAVCVRSRARARFRANAALAATSATQLSSEQKAFKKQYTAGRRELEHEFGKSMRYRSIRDLADGATGAVLRDLKPVWLMSPLSVSDTLPLTSGLFDVVVFDEASQVPLEDAVPSLYRAPQVIVVGDEMQLPPTSFFTAASADADELVAEEDGERISVTLDSDSFLNHANANLPSSLLSWHYRSRSESLISFSNAAFYRGQLRTIPDRGQPLAGRPPLTIRSAEQAADTAGALLDRPISFHLLEHGVYSQRHNLPEAQYTAELVRELLRRGTGRSLGIVAFSEAQQSAIEDALARLAASDPGFAILLEAESEREEDGQYVGLFVKNLENVQGDERDIVILSTCYGRDPAGKMRMNFGPINSSGGEKRLNVIFSRAKHHMAVISSIRHTDITNDWNDGASALKGYLRYAEACSAGDAAAARAVLDGLSPRAAQPASRPGIVAGQLAAALRGRGLVADLGVGQSGFRCDLAVRRPDVEDYQLAVLVDSQPGAHGNEQERYVDRPRALHSTGWAVAHVLAKDWLADPAQVTERLTRIVTR